MTAKERKLLMAKEPPLTQPMWKWRTRSGIAKNKANVEMFRKEMLRGFMGVLDWMPAKFRSICCDSDCVHIRDFADHYNTYKGYRMYRRIMAAYHLTKPPMAKLTMDVLNTYNYYSKKGRGCKCGCDWDNAQIDVAELLRQKAAEVYCPDTDEEDDLRSDEEEE